MYLGLITAENLSKQRNAQRSYGSAIRDNLISVGTGLGNSVRVSLLGGGVVDAATGTNIGQTIAGAGESSIKVWRNTFSCSWQTERWPMRIELFKTAGIPLLNSKSTLLRMVTFWLASSDMVETP